MKILEDFAKISCIGNRWHETSKRKFGEAIFQQFSMCVDDFLPRKKNHILTDLSIILPIFRSGQHGVKASKMCNYASKH